MVALWARLSLNMACIVRIFKRYVMSANVEAAGAAEVTPTSGILQFVDVIVVVTWQPTL